jgi:hypothetical protein
MKKALFYIAISLLILSIITSCAGAANPQGGAVLIGTIKMTRASSANLSLTVSADGSSIETVTVAFTDLQCEGFSAGSSENSFSSVIPINNGEFTADSTSIGDINGKFTSPTSASGSIHLTFFEGSSECGTWDWSASAN